MPCKEWTKSIKGVDDIELDIPRTSVLIYHCAAPESGPAEGLVFVISGFGEDAASDYQRKLRTYLAETYNLLAVSVEYHCYQSRLSTGANFVLAPEEFEDLCKLCAKYGILISYPYELQTALSRLPVYFELDLRIAPSNGDYQNFGVMQALDHLAVLADLLQERGGEFNQENIVAFGASHGGYIAHMISKFAPNTLRAVIDNSSYTDPKRGMMRTVPLTFGKMRLNCLLVSQWELDDQTSSRYFSPGRQSIRHTSSQMQIEEMRRLSQRTCQYRMLHSTQDELEPIEDKRKQAEMLINAGFDVVLKEAGEQDVDGRMVKHLEHGMDASLRALFDYFYPTLTPMPGKLDFELGSDVAYFCGEHLYAFSYGKNGCSMLVVPLDVQGAPNYGGHEYGKQKIEFQF